MHGISVPVTGKRRYKFGSREEGGEERKVEGTFRGFSNQAICDLKFHFGLSSVLLVKDLRKPNFLSFTILKCIWAEKK